MPTYSVIYYSRRSLSQIEGCSKLKSTKKNQCILFVQVMFVIWYVIENINDSINVNIPQYIHVHVYVLHFRMYTATYLCIVIFSKMLQVNFKPSFEKKPRIRYSSTYITIASWRTLLYIRPIIKQRLYILYNAMFS